LADTTKKRESKPPHYYGIESKDYEPKWWNLLYLFLFWRDVYIGLVVKRTMGMEMHQNLKAFFKKKKVIKISLKA